MAQYGELKADSQVVVISGGGTGIGRFLAEGFVENGARVIILGRRGDILDQAAKEINAEYGAASRGEVYA
jgi:3-oxoacyl-[acyl-carrier protein] reductase